MIQTEEKVIETYSVLREEARRVSLPQQKRRSLSLRGHYKNILRPSEELLQDRQENADY